jgi:hypothetical protein
MKKLGHILSLLKKPGTDAEDPANNSSITNLSTMSKLLERLTMMRLKPYITPSQCMQSAYHSMHSTETAMVQVVNDVLTHINAGSLVALISLDISAAFDIIYHNTPSDLLETEFGLTGNKLSWLS